MFGLRQQVGGGEGGRRFVVGQHQHLRGPGGQVDGHVVGADQLLGLGDIAVAGTENLVDARDALRAVGHGRHGLRPADGEDAVDAAQIGGIEDFGGYRAVGARGGAEDDLPAAGTASISTVEKSGALPPGM